MFVVVCVGLIRSSYSSYSRENSDQRHAIISVTFQLDETVNQWVNNQWTNQSALLIILW